MGFKEAVSTCFSKYATFSGRARRSEYWWWYLFTVLSYIVVVLALGVVSFIAKNPAPLLLATPVIWILSLAYLLPGLAVSVRRMHDIGKSGWMLLIGIIPVIGAIILLVFCLTDSQPGDNQYGHNPKLKGEARSYRGHQDTPGMHYSQGNAGRNVYGTGHTAGAAFDGSTRSNIGEETVFDSGRQMRARLILNGRQYSLSNGRNIVGRRGETSQATIQIDVEDRYMSRQHCCITIVPQENGQLRAKISNYNNKNKTVVNGRVLEQNQEAWLPNVCDISMGHTTMKFSM
ncbi:MAG: DUF805 domain-containing protein [Prevotella sp.]|nr:DUF805 domain-containing protein [Prevotella sp.]